MCSAKHLMDSDATEIAATFAVLAGIRRLI
jgi:hypothetical protein